MTASSRTTTTLRALPPPQNGWVKRLLQQFSKCFLRMQSGMFEGLAELWFARDGLAKALECDDRESAYERLGFAALARCTCGHGRTATVYFKRADAWDKQERDSGYGPQIARLDESAAYFRGVSTEIEAGRVLALNAQRAWPGRKGPGGSAA